MADASFPASCVVTVIGSKASIEVARQSVTFDAASTAADMAYAELCQSFKGIDTVSLLSTYGVSVGGATLLDNLAYTTYNAQDKTKKGVMP